MPVTCWFSGALRLKAFGFVEAFHDGLSVSLVSIVDKALCDVLWGCQEPVLVERAVCVLRGLHDFLLNKNSLIVFAVDAWISQEIGRVSLFVPAIKGTTIN